MLGNGYWNKFKCLTQKAGLPKADQPTPPEA
jgi:hypothetical protein